MSKLMVNTSISLLTANLISCAPVVQRTEPHIIGLADPPAALDPQEEISEGRQTRSSKAPTFTALVASSSNEITGVTFTLLTREAFHRDVERIHHAFQNTQYVDQPINKKGNICFDEGIRIWKKNKELGRIRCNKYKVKYDNTLNRGGVYFEASLNISSPNRKDYETYRWVQTVKTNYSLSDSFGKNEGQKGMYVDERDLCGHVEKRSDTEVQAKADLTEVCRIIRKHGRLCGDLMTKYCVVPYYHNTNDVDYQEPPLKFKDPVWRFYSTVNDQQKRIYWKATLGLYGIRDMLTGNGDRLRLISYGFDMDYKGDNAVPEVSPEAIQSLVNPHYEDFANRIRTHERTLKKFETDFEDQLCYRPVKIQPCPDALKVASAKENPVND